MIAPMTSKSHNYPTRIEINFQNKTGWIVLDKIRTVDKKIGELDKGKATEIKNSIMEMLVK
ncbi:hypothetical protein AGMMS50267_11260 [Spirochaetia bacterium]|nr:hypothetical protein AGMMS50267_11260 [Spirochaetia bacterium]